MSSKQTMAQIMGADLGFSLDSMRHKSAKSFVASIKFLLDDVQQLRWQYVEKLMSLSEKITADNPGLSKDAINDLIANDKKFIIWQNHNHARRDILYQSLLLQISSWIAGCYAYHLDRFIKELKVCKQKHISALVGGFRLCGPKYGGKPWAEVMCTSANYVRHKNEWVVRYIYDGDTKKMSLESDAVSKLRDKRSQATAQYLIDLGIPKMFIFGSNPYACAYLLEEIEQMDEAMLEKYCIEWRADLNTLVGTLRRKLKLIK